MAEITIRLSEKSEQVIKAYAEKEGLSVDELMVQSTLEKIGSGTDFEGLADALNKALKDPKFYNDDNVQSEIGK